MSETTSAWWPPIARTDDIAGRVLAAVAEEFGWTDSESAPMEAYKALGLLGAVPTPENSRRIIVWLRENAH